MILGDIGLLGHGQPTAVGTGLTAQSAPALDLRLLLRTAEGVRGRRHRGVPRIVPPGDPSDPAIHAVNRSLAVVSSARRASPAAHLSLKQPDHREEILTRRGLQPRQPDHGSCRTHPRPVTPSDRGPITTCCMLASDLPGLQQVVSCVYPVNYFVRCAMYCGTITVSLRSPAPGFQSLRMADQLRSGGG